MATLKKRANTHTDMSSYVRAKLSEASAMQTKTDLLQVTWSSRTPEADFLHFLVLKLFQHRKKKHRYGQVVHISVIKAT